MAGLLGAVLCAALAVLGEGVNVEKERATPDTPGVSASMDFKLGLRQGNVNLIDVGYRARIAHVRGRHFTLALGESRFASRSLARDGGTLAHLGDRGARFANRHMGHLRYNFRVVRRLAAEAFAQVETDEFLLLRTRVLLGAGPRVPLYDTARFGAYLGPSYLAEHEVLEARFFVSQPGSDSAINWWHRWNNYLSLRVRASERVLLLSTTYVQPRFDAFSDYRLINEGQLEVPLPHHVSLKLLLGIRHDSRPPDYCRAELVSGACVAGEVVTLQATDIALDNAVSVRFCPLRGAVSRDPAAPRAAVGVPVNAPHGRRAPSRRSHGSMDSDPQRREVGGPTGFARAVDEIRADNLIGHGGRRGSFMASSTTPLRLGCPPVRAGPTRPVGAGECDGHLVSMV